jgi:branched-chain amino acid transport system ATP-binding protein
VFSNVLGTITCHSAGRTGDASEIHNLKVLMHRMHYKFTKEAFPRSLCAMLLELNNISKAFGGLNVLSDISFGVKEREIVGLIGPNGAGKTTTFNLISGIYMPTKGNVLFGDNDLVGRKPHHISHLGIARTFQLVRIFPSMTVLENVMVGAVHGRRQRSREKTRTRAQECIEMLGLTDLQDRVASQLTFSDRRLVEIARALASNPILALLDEPLAGLNPSETQQIMAVIREMRDQHEVSILWIEHKIDAVFNVCDRVVVLDYGQMLAVGEPQQIAKNEKVVEAYLGEPLT